MSIGWGGRGCGGGGYRCGCARRPAPLAFDFPSPGDAGGALHNFVAALRARFRPERPRARRTRPHAVYVTRDHRARPLDARRAQKCSRSVLLPAPTWTAPQPALRRRAGAESDVARAKLERGVREACGRRGHPPARPLDTTLHTALYTVGHEKSCPFAGCPDQRTRGNFHLLGSRGHTARVDDRGA